MTLPNPAEHKRTEELYRSVVELAPDSIITVDMEGVITSSNTAATRMLGYSKDELIGKHFSKIGVVRAGEVPKYLELFKSALRGEVAEPLELTFRRKDGTPILVEVHVGVLKEGGKTIGLQAISRDITERKLAEEDAQKRLRGLTALHEVSEVINSTLDLKEVFQRVVDELSNTFGYRLVDIYLLKGETLRLQASVGYDAQTTIELISLERGVVGRVARTGQPAFDRDVSQDPDYIPSYPDIASEICVPIMSGEELLGTLNVEADEKRPLTDDDLQLLSTLSSHIGVAIENARLYEDERRKATQLAVINEVSRKAISILDLDEMLEEVARSIRRGFDYYNVALFLVDKERQEVVIEAVVGGFEHIVPGEYRQPLDQGIIGWVIRTGRPWLANDVSQDPYYIKGFLEEVLTKSELCVPIQLGGEVIGALDIQSIYLDAFDETDVMAMETLSGQIAIAIQNARLYQELRRELTERQRAEEAIRRRTKELAALYDVSLDVAAQLDLDTLLKTILLRAMELLRAKAGGLYLYHLERQELELIVAQGLSKDYTGTRLALGEGACGKVALSKEPLVVTDYINWEGRSRQFNDDPTFNVLAVPIKRGDTLLGALYVDDPDVGRRFEEGDIRLATLFANQAAIAIQNARLYEEERKRSGELSALLDTAQTLASSLDLAQLLETIASQAKELTQADGSRIYLLEPNEKTLRALVVLERYAEEIMATPVLVGQGITGHVASTGIAEIVNHAERDPRAIQIPGTPLEAQCLMCAPLTVKGKAIGAMTLSREGEKEFEDSDLRLLTSLASQAATAIENARLYEETKRLAATDPLTGVWNRRHIEERLRTEAARARRFYHPLSVLVMDLDNLKLFNDTYGHVAGDKVIRTVAQAVLTSCREIDIVGRYGGDEFAVILPEADARGAAMVAERILAALEKEPFQTPGGIKVPINMSVGAASYSSDSDDADRLFSLADAAMYRVKVVGGGQFASLMVGPEEVPEELTAPFDALQGLLIAVDTKDRYTFKHSQEVTERALALARAVGLSEEEMRALEVAGKLHDVGKIGIPAKVLRKPGALTSEEWKTIQEHPRLGYMVLQQLPQMETMLEAVLHHHERWDGNGYPDGLKGKQIPKLARILAIADAYSAMLTDRPYRKALSRQEALREIQDCAGTQFDPELAEIFVDLISGKQEQEG
ncbi:MAG: GAF domain-containing protein [Anaerolineae bacterium]|nr:GAF domain-containing protein [Anaerolineae bacterium]